MTFLYEPNKPLSECTRDELLSFIQDLQDTCAKFCGDNERLLKILGAERVDEVLDQMNMIRHLRETKQGLLWELTKALSEKCPTCGAAK